MAKVMSDPQLTAVGTVVGALQYIPPEQVKGVALDARCDIYSMGVVLYEMLTGRLPFECKSQFELMLAHVKTPARHPSEVNAELPRGLGDVVLKALAKEPAQRFQSAQEFRKALEAAAGSQAATADAANMPATFSAPQPMPESAVRSTSVSAAVATGLDRAGLLFGNTFLWKLSISFAVAAVIFMLGTIVVFAYMELASH